MSRAYIYPPAHPVNAKVTVPGSKSLTNRALVIAALAKGITTLFGASDSNDSLVLIRLLQKLGVEIKTTGDTITVHGNGGKFNLFNGELDVEDAGTVMRFLSALCCIVPGEVILKGTVRMHQRPIYGLVEALKKAGVKIDYIGKEDFPPVKIEGGNFKGSAIHIDASVSSQFVSALLMVAPALSNDTEIICEGELASVPYIDMTLAVMKHFGVEVKHENHKRYFIKGGQSYKASDYKIEGDASSASYMVALAAVTGGSIEVANLSANSVQSDAAFADILGNMGCTVSKGEGVKVTGNSGLSAVNVDMAGMPDTAQTLSVVAAFAEGETIITGLGTLEHKETHRLIALQTELAKMGIDSRIDNSSIRIKGGSPMGADISTYGDHRMAMAFAVAGARIKDMVVENPEVVKKSFPSFWNVLDSTGIKTELK